MNTFIRDDILPSWWANALQKFISNLSSGFIISQFDNTTIQVVAGADDAAAIVSVHGRWRWNEATVQRAHPGGAAGTYDIFVTAVANNVTNVPDPNTDHTNYAFALAIVAHGATPPIVAGVVDIYRKVGELSWDGAKITAITQLVPSKAGPLAHATTHQPGGADALDYTTIHLRGTLAARPAASTANNGLFYYAYDITGAANLFRSTGTAWEAAGGGLGVTKVTAFPSAPAEADLVVRIDQPGDPMYKYVAGAWEQQPRMGAQTVPTVALRQSTDVTLPTGVETALPWDTELFDTDAMHDLVTFTTRLTCKTPGRYLIEGHFQIMSAGVTTQVSIRLNGGADIDMDSAYGSATGRPFFRLTKVVQLAAGDYIEVIAYQNEGGSRTSAASALRSPALTATWLGGAGQTVDERGVPAANCYSAGNVGPIGATNTAVAWDSENYDSDGMHDTAANTTRFTAKTPGIYKFEFAVYLQNTNPGRRIFAFFKNGVEHTRFDKLSTAAGVQSFADTAQIQLAAGDYVELVCSFDQADTLLGGIGSGDGRRPRMSAIMVGSGKTVTPYAKAYHSANQGPIADNTSLFLAFDSELADNDGIHDTVTNNGRLTCRTAGVYQVAAHVALTANVPAGGAQTVQVSIWKNGTDQVATAWLPVGAAEGHVALPLEMAVGDYVQARVYNHSGAAVTVNANAAAFAGGHDAYGTHFEMVKVGAPVAPPVSGSQLVVQDETVPVAQRGVVNFTGAGVQAIDNPASSRTDIVIPGSASFPTWYDDFSVDRLSQYMATGVDSWMGPNPGQYQVVGGQLAVAPAAFTGPRLLILPGLSLGRPRIDCKLAYAGEWTAGAALVMAILWINGDNCIFARQDGTQVLIVMRKGGVESNLAASNTAPANGGQAWYRMMVNGETIRVRRWNADPDIMPAAAAAVDVTANVPSEFLGRSGLCGAGVYVDGGGGAGSRATKLDDLKIGAA